MSEAALTRKLKLTIWVESDWTCYYCGWGIVDEVGGVDDRKATVDHIIPLKDGGTNGRSNLVACCRWCNCSKGTKSLSDFQAHLYHRSTPGRVHLALREAFLDGSSVLTEEESALIDMISCRVFAEFPPPEFPAKPVEVLV